MSKPLTTFLAAIAAALAAACAAAANVGPSFGVADDGGKYADDGGATFFGRLHDVGMTENRVSVFWDPARPTEIVERPFLDRMLPVAEKNGIRVVFSVAPLKARAIGLSQARAAQFVAFLVELMRAYPQVKDVIVGNEPNQPRFWQPQFVNGRAVAGAAYERVLASAYDALKALDPTIRVIGVGLSPRGNDSPNARDNVSRSPVRFIADMGAAYRASGRSRPIMDLFGYHSYPRFDRDPVDRGYSWPNAGITNLDRIKQAIWDAFSGTGQPTFGEAGAAERQDALRFMLDEVGWQVQIPPPFRRAYSGHENVRGTSEATQARIYRQVVDVVACDPSVDSLLFFHLVDERDLDRFQSGLVRADGSLRPSYFAVKQRIAELTGPDGAVRCPGQATAWRPLTGVAGASVAFWTAPRLGLPTDTQLGFSARVAEDAHWDAELVPVDGSDGLSRLQRAALRWVLGKRSTPLESSGLLRPYVPAQVAVPAGPLPAGWYVDVVRVAATLNPSRVSVFVSPAFRAGT